MLLDVEITHYNRPLSYLEDDPQLPVLTPSSMLFMNSNVLPELQPHRIEAAESRKQEKHLLMCKEAVWRRWSKEYLSGLRERLRTQNTSQGNAPAVGDVVILQADERNRVKWPLGIVENLKVDTDGVVRGAILWSGKSRVERAVQQLYPLELLCDRQQPRAAAMNPQVPPFRPRRDESVAARLRVQNIAQDED